MKNKQRSANPNLCFWVVTYREKSGEVIVANKGRVYTSPADANRNFKEFVMHSGCESVTLWECSTREVTTRANELDYPTCKKCGSDRTEYYGAQVHCFACGAVYNKGVKENRHYVSLETAQRRQSGAR